MDKYRIGHSIFTRLEHAPRIIDETWRDHLTLRSESGREIRVDGIHSAVSVDGQQLMFAPKGARVTHPEHGTLELDGPAVYSVGRVREARPEEERARRLNFGPRDTKQTTSSALRENQVD
jgi:hypothetical protein